MTKAEATIKTAYDKFAPEHIGGFVPIYKVRRELGCPREEFDRGRRGLNELADPIIELHEGDPSRYSPSRRHDSLKLDQNLYLRMRWRRR
ncbi:hypothetical protein ACFL2Q_06065 [Thermodesulfobacteriota bacterium]